MAEVSKPRIPRHQKLLDALQAGETHHSQSAADKFHLSRSQVRRVFKQYKDQLHIVDWWRGSCGNAPWAAVYAWGEGKDVPKPRKLSVAEWSRNYRTKHPAKRAIQRAKESNRSAVQAIDPVLAALMGV